MQKQGTKAHHRHRCAVDSEIDECNQSIHWPGPVEIDDHYEDDKSAREDGHSGDAGHVQEGVHDKLCWTTDAIFSLQQEDVVAARKDERADSGRNEEKACCCEEAEAGHDGEAHACI